MAPRFLFVQLELARAPGPAAGRYVVVPRHRLDAAGAAPATVLAPSDPAEPTRFGTADVLVLTERGGVPARRRARRRLRALEPDAEPDDVPVHLATYVEASAPLPDEHEARERLDEIVRLPELRERWIVEGLAVLNRAVRGHRAGAADPYVGELARRDARRVRIGFGTSGEVAEGGWTAALDVPGPPDERTSRASALAPAEAVADALTGRAPVLESEDLLLRALLDLDQGRTRAAALQADAGLRLLLVEAGTADARVRAAAGSAADLAATALRRPLADDELDRLALAVGAGTRALEARRRAVRGEHRPGARPG